MDFDIAMPLTLLCVTLASLYLSKKTENKLKSSFEGREFSVLDVILLVGVIAVMVFLIVFLPQITPLMILFLFSYSSLLFIFTYLFSNRHWYVAVIPPAIFILLYVFLNESPIWSTYLVNIYGAIFAVLITLYLGNLFTWKATTIFAALLTVADIILVLVTKTMVTAATRTSSLNLPVLITLQTFPTIVWDGKIIYMALGLGDFFFAGLLAIQTFRQYGKRLAILSTIGMTLSFFIFEALLLTYRPGPFPGTVMIITGWLPFVIFKALKKMFTK